MNFNKRLDKIASKTQKPSSAEFIYIAKGETEEDAYQRGKSLYPGIDLLIMISLVSPTNAHD